MRALVLEGGDGTADGWGAIFVTHSFVSVYFVFFAKLENVLKTKHFNMTTKSRTESFNQKKTTNAQEESCWQYEHTLTSFCDKLHAALVTVLLSSVVLTAQQCICWSFYYFRSYTFPTRQNHKTSTSQTWASWVYILRKKWKWGFGINN